MNVSVNAHYIDGVMSHFEVIRTGRLNEPQEELQATGRLIESVYADVLNALKKEGALK